MRATPRAQGHTIAGPPGPKRREKYRGEKLKYRGEKLKYRGEKSKYRGEKTRFIRQMHNFCPPKNIRFKNKNCPKLPKNLSPKIF